MDFLSKVQKDIHNFQFVSAKATLELIDVEHFKISKEKVAVISQVLVNLQSFYLDSSQVDTRSPRQFYANDMNFRSLTEKEQNIIKAESKRLNGLFLSPKNNIMFQYMMASCWMYNMDGLRACIWIYRTIMALKSKSFQITEELEGIMGSCRKTLKELSDVMPTVVDDSERPFILYNDFSIVESYMQSNFADEIVTFSKDKNIKLNQLFNNMSVI